MIASGSSNTVNLMSNKKFTKIALILINFTDKKLLSTMYNVYCIGAVYCCLFSVAAVSYEYESQVLRFNSP